MELSKYSFILVILVLIAANSSNLTSITDPFIDRYGDLSKYDTIEKLRQAIQEYNK